jgi:hypothetical protein
LGEPPFVGSDGGVVIPSPAPPNPIDDAGNSADGATATVSLAGTVLGPPGDPVVALVAIEVGGLNRQPPDAAGPDGGSQPSVAIDPFYRYGTLTSDAGRFTLEVPEGELGVHVYANGFSCGVARAGAIDPRRDAMDATDLTAIVRLDPLPEDDGGSPPYAPTITGFTVSPEVVPPGAILTLAAEVAAKDPERDPLSEQVLAVEPGSGWAGILAPPLPGTPGRGYPNGIYNRLVEAPGTPGEYFYYLVAATEACVVSKAAVARVLVTLSGEGGLDAADGGADD